MRFLIIDDSLPMRRIIANVLARLGYTDIVLVTNGREALKRIESEAFDVVITDWYMPEMSGIEFLRTLRSAPGTKDIPIIIVSGNGSKDDVAQAIQLGVSGYVLKPFTAETLRERVAAICSTVRPRQTVPEPAAAAPDPGDPAADSAGSVPDEATAALPDAETALPQVATAAPDGPVLAAAS